MIADRLDDLVARGAGRAALALGGWCDAFRPAGGRAPLAETRRFLRLRAAFLPADGMKLLGTTSWTGVFDHAYTRVGDYLRRAADGGVWFVASQEPLLPVLCVRTTHVLDFSRPGAAALPGAGAYGGVDRATAAPLLTGWPAGVLGGGGGLQAGLPADAGDARWHVLLPVLPPGIELRPGDLMRDESGRGGVVVSAEASALGWALVARQAAG